MRATILIARQGSSAGFELGRRPHPALLALTTAPVVIDAAIEAVFRPPCIRPFLQGSNCRVENQQFLEINAIVIAIPLPESPAMGLLAREAAWIDRE